MMQIIDVQAQIDEARQKLAVLEQKLEYYTEEDLLEVSNNIFEVLCKLDECL